jgi:Rrf2 family protein
MLSQTVEYALRATMYIARGPNQPKRVTEIADAIRAPRNYLAKILGQLARSGVLESSRGANGGFTLDRDAAELRLSDIVAVFEETEQRRCLLGSGVCGKTPACPVHVRWAPIAQSTQNFFAETTLADLLVNSSTSI